MSRRATLRAALMDTLRQLDGVRRPSCADVMDAPPPQYSGMLLVAIASEKESRDEASYRETEVSAAYVVVVYAKRGLASEAVAAVDAATDDVLSAIAADRSLGVTDFAPRASVSAIDLDRGTELDGSAFAKITISVTYRTSATAP